MMGFEKYQVPGPRPAFRQGVYPVYEKIKCGIADLKKLNALSHKTQTTSIELK